MESKKKESAQKRKKTKKTPSGFSQRGKMRVLICVFGVFFLLIFIRIIQVQIILGRELNEESLSQRQDTLVVKSTRGKITDVNGEELAVEVPIYSLWVDAKYLRSQLENKDLTKEEVAQTIGDILGISKEEMLKKIEQNAGFVWIKKKVSYEEVNKIKELDYPGFVFQEESARYYPKETSFGNLLGFVNESGEGGAGVEATYDEILAGEDGYVEGEKDGKNNFLADSIKTVKEPVDGNSIKLTIDQKVQYIAEREIANIVKDLNPKSATIIVMKTKTGEILGVADTNAYDPNLYTKVDNKFFQTTAFQTLYEPGSTMKPILAAAGLNEGALTPESTFYDNGYINIDSYAIKCWLFPEAHGTETLVDAIADSCNPAIIQAALLLRSKDEDAWYRYMSAFGFGKVTSVGFAGEGQGILPPNNGIIYNATSVIGQGVSVTPLQMTVALSAIGNEGKLMEPMLVKEISDSSGKVLDKREPKVSKEVVSKETAQTTLSMMNEVMIRGTGTSGQPENIQVAGKTGTAEKTSSDGTYFKNKYILSFIGMAPYENPEYTVTVIIDEPEEGGISSSIVGPYFKTVMEDVLKLETSGDTSAAVANEDTTPAIATVPNLNGLTLSASKKELDKLGLVFTYEGEGYVTGQDLAPMSKVPKGSNIHLTLVNKELQNDELVVPDFVGLRIPNMIERKGVLRLKLNFKGMGIVRSQSIPSGTIVKKDTVIDLELGE